MFACPHCGETIEVSRKEKIPWWRHDPGGPTARLGCGALVIIAIIVAIFSNGSNTDVKCDLQGFDERLQRLETSIERLVSAQSISEP